MDGMQAVRLGVVGDAAVGKTLLLVSYTANYVRQEYVPTVFDSYWTTTVVDGQPIDLTALDNSGQDVYDELRPLSYAQTDVFLVCFSLLSRQSFARVGRKWHPELQTRAPNAPFLLVGCQKDLCQGSVAAVATREGQELAKRLGAVTYIESSAVSQEGLTECFNCAIRSALSWQKVKST